MATREAACHCGQLRLEVDGDPFVVSICHCLACQRRTGSAFGMQAAFRSDQVQVTGRFSDFVRVSDEADRKEHAFHFCPDCGSQVFYTERDEPELVVVSVGSFADPTFPPPSESGYEFRRHPWIGLSDSIRRDDSGVGAWAPVAPLYEEGRYAAAADKGREVLETNPHPRVLYNVACCESLAGRTADAIGHLRQAIDGWQGCRDLAKQDEDFDAIRSEPAFAELVGRRASPVVPGALLAPRFDGHGGRERSLRRGVSDPSSENPSREARMSTPERQQDAGEHGYGGVQAEKQDDEQEHPLEDPQADPREPEERQGVEADEHDESARAKPTS